MKHRMRRQVVRLKASLGNDLIELGLVTSTFALTFTMKVSVFYYRIPSLDESGVFQLDFNFKIVDT